MTKQPSLSRVSTPTGSTSSLDELHDSPTSSASSELRNRSYQSTTRSEAPPVNTLSHEMKLNSSSSQKNVGSPKSSEQFQTRKIILLLVCASGICSCYLYFGIVQERLLSKESPSSAILNQIGSITTFMLVLSSATNVIVASFWLLIKSSFFPDSANGVADCRPINHKLLLGGELDLL